MNDCGILIDLRKRRFPPVDYRHFFLVRRIKLICWGELERRSWEIEWIIEGRRWSSAKSMRSICEVRRRNWNYLDFTSNGLRRFWRIVAEIFNLDTVMAMALAPRSPFTPVRISVQVWKLDYVLIPSLFFLSVYRFLEFWFSLCDCPLGVWYFVWLYIALWFEVVCFVWTNLCKRSVRWDFLSFPSQWNVCNSRRF